MGCFTSKKDSINFKDVYDEDNIKKLDYKKKILFLINILEEIKKIKSTSNLQAENLIHLSIRIEGMEIILKFFMDYEVKNFEEFIFLITKINNQIIDWGFYLIELKEQR